MLTKGGKCDNIKRSVSEGASPEGKTGKKIKKVLDKRERVWYNKIPASKRGAL